MKRILSVVKKLQKFLILPSLALGLTYSATVGNSFAEEYRALDNLLGGSQEIFKGSNLTLLGIGTGLTIVSLYLDPRVYNFLSQKNWSLGTPGALAVEAKTEPIPLAIGVSTLIYGLLSDRTHEIDAGQAQLESIASYSLYVAALKFFTYRDGPPPDSLRHSFPSGQIQFVTAGVMAQAYGFIYSTPFLLVGTLGVTHYALISGHWLSDLIFGSFLGYVTGRAFMDFHNNKHSKIEGTSTAVIPFFGHAETGSLEAGITLKVQY